VYWVRIDNRLVHGQIIEAWIPFTAAGLLVVANDRLKADPIQQEIISLAIPPGVKAIFVDLKNITDLLHRQSRNNNNILVLFANCKDARSAFDLGLDFGSLNVGNLHYSPGKRQVCAHVALSTEDEDCLRFFLEHGVQLDFRCVPNDPVQVKGF